MVVQIGASGDAPIVFQKGVGFMERICIFAKARLLRSNDLL